jgi:hypothetical protein
MKNMMDTTITEQTKSVKWNGSSWLLRFPTSVQSQRRAVLSAFDQYMPEVADEIRAIIYNTRKLPQAEAVAQRAIRAGFILKEGKLWPPRDPQITGHINEVARAQGSRGEEYTLSFDGEELYCDCPDFQAGKAPELPSGQIACKHVISILISDALREDF